MAGACGSQVTAWRCRLCHEELPSKADCTPAKCLDLKFDPAAPSPLQLRTKIAASEDELLKEKSCVSHLIGQMGGSCDIRGAPDTTVRK